MDRDRRYGWGEDRGFDREERSDEEERRERGGGYGMRDRDDWRGGSSMLGSRDEDWRGRGYGGGGSWSAGAHERDEDRSRGHGRMGLGEPGGRGTSHGMMREREGGQRGGDQSYGGGYGTTRGSTGGGSYSSGGGYDDREWSPRQQYGGQQYGGQQYGGRDFGGGRLSGRGYHGGREPGGRDFGGREPGGRDFGGRDFGGRDFGGRDLGGRERERWSGQDYYDRDTWMQDRDREEGGFFSRMGEGIKNVFGMGDRDRGPHFGKGPKGYRRSDERIREEVSEVIARQGWIDASDVEVKVQSGEVTLTGTVDHRDHKRRLEQMIEDLPGVDDVRNEIRVKRAQLGAAGGAYAGGEASTPETARATGRNARTS